MGRKIRPMVEIREEVVDESLSTVYYVLYLDTDDNQYHVGYRSPNTYDVRKYLREQFGYYGPLDQLVPFDDFFQKPVRPF